MEFENENLYHTSSEEQFLNFYNQNLEEVKKINSPLLSISLYHIPIGYYENNYNVKYQKQLIYFYQRIYWLLKHNPGLKHLGEEVEILRISK